MNVTFALLQQALKYHPDKNPNNPEATAKVFHLSTHPKCFVFPIHFLHLISVTRIWFSADMAFQHCTEIGAYLTAHNQHSLQKKNIKSDGRKTGYSTLLLLTLTRRRSVELPTDLFGVVRDSQQRSVPVRGNSRVDSTASPCQFTSPRHWRAVLRLFASSAACSLPTVSWLYNAVTWLAIADSCHFCRSTKL